MTCCFFKRQLLKLCCSSETQTTTCCRNLLVPSKVDWWTNVVFQTSRDLNVSQLLLTEVEEHCCIKHYNHDCHMNLHAELLLALLPCNLRCTNGDATCTCGSGKTRLESNLPAVIYSPESHKISSLICNMQKTSTARLPSVWHIVQQTDTHIRTGRRRTADTDFEDQKRQFSDKVGVF